MQAPQGAAQVGPQGAAQVGAALPQPLPLPQPAGAAQLGAQQFEGAPQQLLLWQRILGRRHFFSRLPKLWHFFALQQLVGAQQSEGAGAQHEAAGAQQLGAAAPQPVPHPAGAAQVGAALQPFPHASPHPAGAAQLGPAAPHASPQGAAQEGAESQQECRWSLNKPAFAMLEPATTNRAAVRVVHFILKSPKFPGVTR